MFTLEHAWALLITIFMAVLGWLRIIERDEIKAMKEAINAANTRAEDAEEALAAHKLFAAETYARSGEVKAMVAELKADLIREIDQRSNRELALLEEIRAQTRRAN